MYHSIIPVYNGSFTIKSGRDKTFVSGIPSFIFLIISEDGEKILVDTGFSKHFIPGPNSSYTRKADEEILKSLSNLGYYPEDITSVIQTHLHWDHTGGMHLFSHSRFYLQIEELKALLTVNVNAECSFCPSHWIPLFPNFKLLNGDTQIKPGLNAIFTGGHTSGHQAVEVNTRTGTVILGGDAPFNYGDWWKMVPEQYWQIYRSSIGKHLFWDNDIRSQIKDYLISCEAINTKPPQPKQLKELKTKSRYFLTSHDPRLLKIEAI